MDIENLSLDQLGQLDLSLDVWSLVAGLLFSLVGWWLYRQGKYKDEKRFKYVGIALMVYPYFVRGALMNWAVGLLLCGYAYYWWD